MKTGDPVECLREEVQRFKDTNTFTPMLVTGFYLQAAIVLDEHKQLTESNRQLREELEKALQYRTGHSPECGGMDEENQRCDCGYLQGSAYRHLVEELEKVKVQADKFMGGMRWLDAKLAKKETALAAAKEALRRIATHFPIDDGEEVKSLARHKCDQARDALARIAEWVVNKPSVFTTHESSCP